MVKKIKHIFIMLLCTTLLWGCGKSENNTETVSESAPKDLRELNEECITIKTGETEMDTETEGTVQLSVEFPDTRAYIWKRMNRRIRKNLFRKLYSKRNLKPVKLRLRPGLLLRMEKQ